MSHEVFSPRSRGRIIHTVLSGATHAWKGTRRGVQLTIKLSDKPNAQGERIFWGATYEGKACSGTATTCYQAMNAIETFVEERRSTWDI